MRTPRLLILPVKKEKKPSIRHRLLHLGSKPHANATAIETSLNNEELMRLEEAKNRLFASTNTCDVNEYEPASEPMEDTVASPSRSVAFAFTAPKQFSIPGLHLPALAAFEVDVREVTLHRNISGDFGFTIRRAQYPLPGSSQLRTVVFAEPADVLPGPPRPSDLVSCLLPGDQLLQVEGEDVETLSREELQKVIQNAGNSLRLRVRSVPELAELCGKAHHGVRDHGDVLRFNASVETASTETIPDDERYWLVHSNAYSLVRLVEHLPDGKAKIVVSDTEMVVDSSDIDRANPSSFDRAGDIASLKYLNETSMIHLLRQRCGSGLQFTNAGSQMLVYLSGEQVLDANDNLVKLFKGCRRSQMPAHVYATAQNVYRNLQMTGRSQSVVLTGVTGSGKSAQLRNFVHYLSSVASKPTAINYDKISLSLAILEAFGNCATRLNQNSSRFILLLSLGFDTSATLCSAKAQSFLLETTRLTRRPERESTFHVFYYFWEGIDASTRDRLQLELVPNPFIHSLKGDEDKEAAKIAWKRLLASLSQAGVSEKQTDGICDVLAAIFHLMHAEATNGVASKSNFIRITNAETAARLLGLNFEELSQAVFKGTSAQMVSISVNRFSMSNRSQTGQEALQTFVQSLYNELFSTICGLISKSMDRGAPHSWITLLDCPGSSFNQQWTKWGADRPLGLNDLVYNYFNERLAEMSYDYNFQSPAEVYPGATDHSFFERIFIHFERSRLIKRHPRNRLQFVLSHCLGTADVPYSVEDWLRQAQPSHAPFTVPILLQSSKRESLAELFTNRTMSHSDSALKLRRATQNVQNDVVSRSSMGGFLTGGIEIQAEFVLGTVKKSSRLFFVHCVQPQPPSAESSQMLSYTSAESSGIGDLDVPFVRQQLRSVLLLDAVRAHNRGYPERMPFRDFRRRFQCLTQETNQGLTDALDDRTAVQRILEKMEIYDHRYRLGISQVLLRNDVLIELEERRDLCLSGLIVDLQRACRLHLARRWLNRRRLEERAVRCIQRNINVYLRVREWPWWKLYSRVSPLLAASRSDTEGREFLLRIQRLEAANTELSKQKASLEEELFECKQLLKSECQASQNLGISLDSESQIRVQLETEVRELRNKVQAVTPSEVEERKELLAAIDYDWSKDEKTTALRGELDELRASDALHRLKAQKAVEEVRDLRAEMEDLKARNVHVESRTKNFDGEVNTVRAQLDELRHINGRLEKERDELTFNSLKEENAEIRTSLTKTRRELDEILDSNAAGGAGADEISAVRKAKRDLEAKVAELEDELDECVTKNMSLEKNVTRLEMGAERSRADLQREVDSKESELADVRAQFQRRLRSAEEQVNELSDANSSLVKQNRILESRIRDMETHQSSFPDVGAGQYKRELRKVTALLRDAQTALYAHERENAPSHSIIRQLKEQLEDAEAAKLGAVKGRHSLENEIAELRNQLDATTTAKTAAEDKVMVLLKEKNSAMSLVEDHDEQLQALLKKYKAQVQQSSVDAITLSDQIEQIADLEKAKQRLQEQLNEAQSSLEFLKLSTVEKHKYQLLELKVRDLEAKLDVEQASKQRLEAISTKLKDEVDSLQEQLDEAKTAREREVDGGRKYKKEISNLQEQINDLKKRETEMTHKYRIAKSENDKLAEELQITQNDLRVALRRIDALQAALNADITAGSDIEEEDEECDETHSSVSDVSATRRNM
ncbi:Myosin head [Aphelenchoides avenae]|nr:Myosin head [Aphelenchus avenae]